MAKKTKHIIVGTFGAGLALFIYAWLAPKFESLSQASADSHTNSEDSKRESKSFVSALPIKMSAKDKRSEPSESLKRNVKDKESKSSTEVLGDDPPIQRPGVERLNCKDFSSDCGECWEHKDCPSGAVCLIDPETQRHKCFSDNCTYDGDCESGSVCRVLGLDGFALEDDGSLIVDGGIRLCVPATLKLGDLCPPTSPKAGCAPDLACVRGFCQQRCDADSDCPEGAGCQPIPEGGQACHFGCPECSDNEACIDGVTDGRCVRLIGTNCFVEPCDDGEHCSVGYNPASYAIVGECVTPCGDSSTNNRTCPDDQVCGSMSPKRCLTRCDPKDARGCPEGKHCVVVEHAPELIWGCANFSGF